MWPSESHDLFSLVQQCDIIQNLFLQSILYPLSSRFIKGFFFLLSVIMLSGDLLKYTVPQIKKRSENRAQCLIENFLTVTQPMKGTHQIWWVAHRYRGEPGWQVHIDIVGPNKLRCCTWCQRVQQGREGNIGGHVTQGSPVESSNFEGAKLWVWRIFISLTTVTLKLTHLMIKFNLFSQTIVNIQTKIYSQALWLKQKFQNVWRSH